jgi:hypothetical protein
MARPSSALLIGLVLLFLALGVAAYTLMPRSEPLNAQNAEPKLEAVLRDVQTKQEAYKAQHGGYAATLEELGFGNVESGFSIEYRSASPLDYCWLGKTARSPVWFTVTKDRVVRTKTAVSAPPPICVAP